MNPHNSHLEYRVIWKRRDQRRRERRYRHLLSAERLASLLRATSAAKVLALRGLNPDDYACCSGYECGCNGATYLDREEEYREQLPPLDYCVIEERRVEPWRATVPTCPVCGEVDP